MRKKALSIAAGVAMIGQIENEIIPAWVLLLYRCKAACWIALPAALPSKKKRTEPEAP